MENKYTCEYDDCSGTYRIKDIGLFFNEKDAQEYIAWKNQTKINKIHKSDIVNFLIILAEMQNSTEYLKTAKIIDSLEADDGK